MKLEEFCRNHPDRQAVVNCQKYGYGYCDECLETDPHCSEPEIYCKFRPQCVINFQAKENRLAARRAGEYVMDDKQVYSDFIRQLPQADAPLPGVDVRLLTGAEAQAAFFFLPAGTKIPPHSHCAQWGIVVDGEIELTIGMATHIFHKGDRYHIADGEVHSAIITQDSWVIDVFADPTRYAAK